jgi:hypothetical protein
LPRGEHGGHACFGDALLQEAGTAAGMSHDEDGASQPSASEAGKEPAIEPEHQPGKRVPQRSQEHGDEPEDVPAIVE